MAKIDSFDYKHNLFAKELSVSLIWKRRRQKNTVVSTSMANIAETDGAKLVYDRRNLVSQMQILWQHGNITLI